MNKTERLLDTGWTEGPGLGFYWGAFGRQAPILILASLLAGSIGLAYAIASEPLYTASANLRVEVEGETLSELVSPFSTHIELIGSDRTTRDVIGMLDLGEAFAGSPGRLRGLVTDIRRRLDLGEGEDMSDDADALIVRNVARDLDVDRLGNTSIIEISFTSPSRAQASAIANAYAEAYLEDIGTQETERLERRLERMDRRAADLGAAAERASQAAQEILAQNGFVVFDSEDLQNSIAGFRERLSEVNSQEAVIRARLASFDGLSAEEELRSASLLSDTTTETYFELQRAEDRLSTLSDQSGVPDETIAQLEDAAATLRGTLGQAFERSRRELAVELTGLQALRENLGTALSDLQGYGRSPEWTEFLAVEREAATYEELRQSYIAREEELYRQGPDAPIRLVSEAALPAGPSFPDYKVVLAISVTLGLVIGVGVALLREWSRRPVMSGRHHGG